MCHSRFNEDGIDRTSVGGASRTLGSESPSRILIVEDETIVAQDMGIRLTSLGYQVVGFSSSGEDAIRRSDAEAPDLVLMDIGLDGDMDGINAARILQNNLRIPVVFLSGSSDDATISRATQSRPMGYVVKPVQDRELRLAVEVALGRYPQRHHRSRAEQRSHAGSPRFQYGVIVATNCHEVIHFNPAAERILDIPSQVAMSSKIDDVFSLREPCGKPMFEHGLNHWIRRQQGMEWIGDAVIPSSGRGLVPVRCEISGIGNDGDHIQGVVCAFRELKESGDSVDWSALFGDEGAGESLFAELSDALDEMFDLEGLISICLHCKRIRDRKGFWASLERYVEARSQAKFSHGICPSCLHEHYPDFAEDVMKGIEQGDAVGCARSPED